MKVMASKVPPPMPMGRFTSRRPSTRNSRGIAWICSRSGGSTSEREWVTTSITSW